MRRLLIVSLNGDPLADLGSMHAGGQCRYVLEISKGLLHRGWGVHILTLQNPGRARHEWMTFNVDVWRVPLPDGRAYDAALSEDELDAVTAGFLRLAGEENLAFDGVLACYWISAITGLTVAHRFGIPLVISFCSLGHYKRLVEDSPRIARRIAEERRLAAAATHVIATNREEATTLRDVYGVDPVKLSIIPRGIDLEVFHPRD